MNMKLEINKEASRLLDVLRGVAALLVVLGHSREYAAKTFNINPTGDSLFERFLLIPSSFAMESVAVFFVLSGLLVGGQTIRLVNENNFYWLDFIAKRLSRLWTVLLPGIFLTWSLWWLNFYLWQTNANEPSLIEGVCNITFLQEAWCNPFSNNMSLWSLSYEFWFYITFAGFMLCIVNAVRNNYHSAIFGLIVTLLVAITFGIKLFYLIPGWLIGALIAICFSKVKILDRLIIQSTYLHIAISIVLISIFSIISNILHLGRETLTIFVSIPTALFIYSALHAKNEPKKLKNYIDIGASLGNWSFSIYVFHLPIVITILYLIKNLGYSTMASLPFWTYLTTLIAIPFTLLLWYLTERHTTKVRKLFLLTVAKLRP